MGFALLSMATASVSETSSLRGRSLGNQYASLGTARIERQLFSPNASFPAGALPVYGMFAAVPPVKSVNGTRGLTSSGSQTNSITVSGGGLGAVQGATFTCAGHSTTEVDMIFHTTAISQDDMNKVDALIKAEVSSSDYKRIHDHEEASASGGWSLFGGASVSASASATHDAMSGYGLSEEMQQKVLEMVKELLPTPSTFKYKTTVTNNTPFQQSGQMYVYSFTGTITSGDSSVSKQMIGGPVAKTASGDQLPVTTTFS